MLITEGECTITIGTENFTAKKGQLAFINCYEAHAYSSNKGWAANWLHFDGPMAKQYFEYIIKSGSPVLTPSSNSTFILEFNKLYSSFKNGNIPTEAVLSLSITTMLTELSVNTHTSEPEERNKELISEITNYINVNFHMDISLEMLANKAHLSPFYFSKLFKNKTGYTPHEYIITTRLNQSKYMLKNTSMTIKEICFACGFASESRFCTSFKNNIGMTPSEYRG